MIKFTSTKAQIWGYDLLVAVTIFVAGLIIAYVYATNFNNESQDTASSFLYTGNLISSLILSEGSPANWSPSDYQIPGIISDKKVNQTKLDNFYSLDYQSVKRKLNSKYNFYFTLPDLQALNNPVDGIGQPPISPNNVFAVERFTIYNNKPAKFTIYIWN